MRAPKRYHNEILEDGTSMKFRLTIKTIRKLEESTGKKWQEVMEDMGDDPMGTFVDITWAASLPFDKEFTKEMAAEVYDMLIDDGQDQSDINKFIMKVMQASGLFPKDKNVDEYMDEAMSEAEDEEDDPK